MAYVNPLSLDISFPTQDAFGLETSVLVTSPCGNASFLTTMFCVTSHFVL